MARNSKGITQVYLPPTHEPYLPLLLPSLEKVVLLFSIPAKWRKQDIVFTPVRPCVSVKPDNTDQKCMLY